MEDMSITQETIKSQIFTIRGKQVMIDRGLAILYGVETRVLNQAVKRNQERFPESFTFLLIGEYLENLRSQFVISSFGYGGRRYSSNSCSFKILQWMRYIYCRRNFKNKNPQVFYLRA